MVADKEVSVGWQMFFTLIPILDIWAFYRIENTWKGLALILGAPIVVGFSVGFWEGFTGVPGEDLSLEGTILTIVISIGVIMFFIAKWSRAWNENIGYQSSIL